MMKNRFYLSLFFFLITSKIIFSQVFSCQPIPAWVKSIDIPVKSFVSKYDIQSGYYLALGDYQINLEESATFTHEVINVISYSGITNASQISVTYDTSYQKLKIHHLYIWRKGEKLDRTKNLSFEIMNNEQNLQIGIYTGKITAYDILNDIRKDDFIDFAYTLVGDNPIFNDEKYFFIPLETINPMDLYSVRILYSNKDDYTFECSDCDSIISENDIDGFHEILIQINNVSASKFEENIPTWIIPYRYFKLTSFKSWKDVNKWAENVFSLDKKPEFISVFNEIFNGNETMDEKINKIIDFVQDEIRYMGIETGIGSIKPFPPEQVIKQRFGDCKDKSLLLVSLLKEIGIEKAWPVLVNTVYKRETSMFGPGNQIFNHCIVKFEYNNKSYWIDPTISMQGGEFKDIFTPDYGKVLVIGLQADTLSDMCVEKTNSHVEYIDEFTIESFTKPAKFQITSLRSGFEADIRRSWLEYYSTKDIEDQLTKDLKLQFPIVNKTDEIKIVDDLEKNSVQAIYNYDVDGFFQDGDKINNASSKGYWIFRFEPWTLYQYINSSICDDRKFDFALTYPLNMSYQIIFHFPKDILVYDLYDIYDNEYFMFDKKIEQLSSNSIKIDYTFRTKSDFIKAADFKTICEEKNNINKGLPLIFYFSK